MPLSLPHVNFSHFFCSVRCVASASATRSCRFLSVACVNRFSLSSYVNRFCRFLQHTVRNLAFFTSRPFSKSQETSSSKYYVQIIGNYFITGE